MSDKSHPSLENHTHLTSSVPLHTQSVEADADRLMDDLFSDIDRILNGGSQLPNEPIHPDYIALKSVVVPPIIMPPPASESAIIPQEVVASFSAKGNISHPQKQKSKPDQPSQDRRFSFDQILFVLASLSLLGVIGWLIYQNKISLPFLNQNTPQPLASVNSANDPISPEDRQFIAYMLRSLEVIDSQTPSTKTPQTNTSTIPPNLPIPPISNPNNSNQPQTVIERIYIPYPSGQVPSNNANPSYSNPSTLPIPNPAPTTIKTPPKTNIPAPPSGNTPSPVPLNPSTNLPNLDFNVPPPPLPGVSHTLIGLLEDGNNSAALFDVNGSTQRIKVGEQIGTSGWTLVSVASQQATIRRNGEIRSIFVGQKF